MSAGSGTQLTSLIFPPSYRTGSLEAVIREAIDAFLAHLASPMNGSASDFEQNGQRFRALYHGLADSLGIDGVYDLDGIYDRWWFNIATAAFARTEISWRSILALLDLFERVEAGDLTLKLVLQPRRREDLERLSWYITLAAKDLLRHFYYLLRDVTESGAILSREARFSNAAQYSIGSASAVDSLASLYPIEGSFEDSRCAWTYNLYHLLLELLGYQPR